MYLVNPENPVHPVKQTYNIEVFQRFGSIKCWTWHEVQLGLPSVMWQLAHVVRGVTRSGGSNELWQLEHESFPSEFPFIPGAIFTR